MPISPFYAAIRARVGSRLLLMPAVAAIVRDADGFILLQRTQHGAWSLPAGAIEPGESPAQALVREVHEETGLVVRPERVLAVQGGAECRVTYPNGDEVEYVVTVFECSVIGGALLDSNDETAALEWRAPEDVPPLGFPCARAVLSGAVTAPLFEWREEWLAPLETCVLSSIV